MSEKSIEITKEKFEKFTELQEMGVINMLDIKSGTTITGLTEDEYKDIIFNYKKYDSKFNSNETQR